MKKFSEIKINEDVEFYALVESLQKRFTPNKSSYYSINLSDGDTIIDARVWDTNLIENIEVNTGKVYFFEAHVNEYASKAQYVIRAIKVPEKDEVNINQFLRSAPLSEEELRSGINGYIAKISNNILKKLVITLIKKVEDAYFNYPAAMSMHHNYRHGLVYHTYTMLQHAEAYLNLYPGMNSDLLYAGVLIHDIGKTKELSGVQSPTYTGDGNLLGHIIIGLTMIAAVASELAISDTEEVKMLEHLMISHHGELEYGSPKEPGSMEAFALYLIDFTDSRLASISPEVVKTKSGENTGPIGSIGRRTIYVPNIEEKM